MPLRGGRQVRPRARARCARSPTDYLRRLPADRLRLPRAAALHLPELALERGGAAAAAARCSRASTSSRCRYQAGTLLFHRDADPETLRWLRALDLPAARARHDVRGSAQVREAATWVLGQGEADARAAARSPRRRAAALLQARGAAAARLPAASSCSAGPRPDELNRGFGKLNVAFTLPPGQLRDAGREAAVPPDCPRGHPGRDPRHTGWRLPGPRRRAEGHPARPLRFGRTPELGPRTGDPGADDRRRLPSPGKARRDDRPVGAPRQRSTPVPVEARDAPTGFLARAKARKEAKASARARQKLR